MDTLFAALRSLLYGVVGVVLFTWAILRVRLLDGRLGIRLPAWGAAPGIIVSVLGGMLILSGFVVFLTRGRGTPFVADPPKDPVASGPYRRIRNPIYTGQVLTLAGVALALRSSAVLLLGASIVGAFLNRFTVGPQKDEQGWLKEQLHRIMQRLLQVHREAYK